MPALLDPDGRHVRRLRVRAATPADAHRASVLVEDALRTASFPGADQGRVWLIRRLALPIPQHASPGTVALQIERSVLQLASSAVPFDDSSAAGADVVVFPDRVRALVQLARRQARGAQPPEWFWPRLVPGWRSEAHPEDNWARLFEAAHALPEAAVAAAALVNEAAAAGRAAEVLGSVSTSRALLWLQTAGFDPVDATSVDSADDGLRLGPWSARLAEELPPDGPSDGRWVWLVTLLAVHEQPSRAGNPRLPRGVRRWLETSLRPESPVGGAARPRRGDGVTRAAPPSGPPAAISGAGSRSGQRQWSPDSSPAPTGDDPSPARVNREPGQAQPRAAQTRTGEAGSLGGTAWDPAGSDAGQPPSGREELASHSPGDPAAYGGRALVDQPFVSGGRFTACGGLFFLLPVVERLGMAGWLERHPLLLEAAFPVRLLQFIGERAGLDVDDPLWQTLEALSRREPLPPVSDWPGPVDALLAAPRPRGRLDSPLDVWLTAIRRWCRRNAGMGLVSVIRRPGRLRVSPTHLEMGFDLSRLDLRVRRSALDVDPGWVPWLGRVIRFHYLDS